MLLSFRFPALGFHGLVQSFDLPYLTGLTTTIFTDQVFFFFPSYPEFCLNTQLTSSHTSMITVRQFIIPNPTANTDLSRQGL